MNQPNSDEVTPPELYFNRRRIMRAGAIAASVTATAAVYRWLNPTGLAVSQQPEILPPQIPPATSESGSAAANPADQPAATEPLDAQQAELLAKGFTVDEPLTHEQFIINYNNFYEFSLTKEGVAPLAADFKTTGWQVKVDGLVDKPGTYTIDQLHALSAPQERIYRMRCVEGWSMVIPWVGLPLVDLLTAVVPKATAKFVAFETLLDVDRMPGQLSGALPWPYVEGLRLDEAMHPLTILATGLYRKALPPQDGAPIRLVVPWKYGFKGIKSIVRISLVTEQPPTTWNVVAPNEYGFYANVNPKVDHPRWSQATEQRIGERGRRNTLMFNGYEDQVARLYTGMDLTRHY